MYLLKNNLTILMMLKFAMMAAFNGNNRNMLKAHD